MSGGFRVGNLETGGFRVGTCLARGLGLQLYRGLGEGAKLVPYVFRPSLPPVRLSPFHTSPTVFALP